MFSRAAAMAGSASVVAAAALPQRSRGEVVAAASGVNVLLVHGIWADGSSWAKVIALLQTDGHNVVAVQNQLASLKDDVANTRAAIDALEGPTVLVGHSYGGSVITAAGLDAPKVTALVYLAAFAPDDGESIQDINARFPSPPGSRFVRPDSRGWLFLDRAQMPSAFCGDVPLAEGRVIAAAQRPALGAVFSEKSGKPAWRQHKSWYQLSENDLMINPDAERFMATRSAATMISLKSSHASLVSHPREVADLIKKAAAG